MWKEGNLDDSGWSFHHQGAYLGNEGNEDSSVYSRYILTFCRREAVVAHQTGDHAGDPKLEEQDSDEEAMDRAEQLRQRNAAGDARAMAKF